MANPFRTREPVPPGHTATNDDATADAGWRRARVAPSLQEVYRSVPVGSGGFFRKLLAFAGPGYLVAVGYMDPGNWATDLAGGSRFGYTLLSVILLSNLMAVLLQGLALQARHRHRARSGAGLPRSLLAPGRRSRSGCCARSRSPPAIWPR